MSSATDDAVDALAAIVAASEALLMFTGAGISTASGIPDYRGPQGVWLTKTPVYYDDFMRSPDERKRYWEQKLEDRQSLSVAKPNEVHASIVHLERAGKVEAVVTQNVDGLHAEAGTTPERLVEIHGTTRQVECQSCGARSHPEPHFALFAETGTPPLCGCGGYLKPATISFGQQLRHDDLQRAFEAADRCDAVLAVGSTLSVNPAATVPLVAARRGVPYVIINRGPTDHDGSAVVTLRIEADVNDILPQAVANALAPNQDGSSR